MIVGTFSSVLQNKYEFNSTIVELAVDCLYFLFVFVVKYQIDKEEFRKNVINVIKEESIEITKL